MKFELTHDNATDTLVLRLELPTQELAAMFTHSAEDDQVGIALLALAAGGMSPQVYLHAAAVVMQEAQRVGTTVDLSKNTLVPPSKGVQ